MPSVVLTCFLRLSTVMNLFSRFWSLSPCFLASFLSTAHVSLARCLGRGLEKTLPCAFSDSASHRTSSYKKKGQISKTPRELRCPPTLRHDDFR